MKLIAETEEENSMLPGISALMTDLGVIVTEYRKDEAYAMVCWSASDLSYLLLNERFDLTKDEAAYLLEELEPFLRVEMTKVGVRLIERALDKKLSEIKRLVIDPLDGL